MRRLLPYLPLLLVGPVAGPLLALGVLCASRRQWVRAGLCFTGVGLDLFGVPLLTAALAIVAKGLLHI